MSRKSERECPERRDEAKERMWRGIIAEQEASGKSILGFLRERAARLGEERGVNETNFFSWRAKIRLWDGVPPADGEEFRRKVEHWRGVFREFRDSRMTKKAFLRERGIARSTFDTWRRHVAAADRRAAASGEAAGKPTVAANRPAAQPRSPFVEARVVESPAGKTAPPSPAGEDRIEIELPSGVKLRVAASALRDVITLLGS